MLPLLFELMLGFGSSLTVISRTPADLRAFVASEKVEVRTAPPVLWSKGKLGSAAQMEAWVAQANDEPSASLPSPTSADWAVAKRLVDAEDCGFYAPAAGWRFHRLPTACVDSCLGLVGLGVPPLRLGASFGLGSFYGAGRGVDPADVFSLLLLLVPLSAVRVIILLVLLPSGRVARGRCVLAHEASEPLAIPSGRMVFRVPMVG